MESINKDKIIRPAPIDMNFYQCYGSNPSHQAKAENDCATCAVWQRCEAASLSRSTIYRERSNYNNLTSGETERLAILAEECSGVIQIIGKILRHGYRSSNPNDSRNVNNRRLLEIELGHVDAMKELMIVKDDVIKSFITSSCMDKHRIWPKYLHHN